MNKYWLKFHNGALHNDTVQSYVKTYNDELEKKMADKKFLDSCDIMKLVKLGWTTKELAEMSNVVVKSLGVNEMTAEKYRHLLIPAEVEIVYGG